MRNEGGRHPPRCLDPVPSAQAGRGATQAVALAPIKHCAQIVRGVVAEGAAKSSSSSPIQCQLRAASIDMASMAASEPGPLLQQSLKP